jgi:SAM-dependent methyltransferase
LPNWYLDHLACPDCRQPLAVGAGPCACGFAVGESTPLDLRPRRPERRTLDVSLRSAAADLESCLVERPAHRYAGPRAERDSSELFSAIEPSLQRGMRLLDLGCGQRDQAACAEHYGLEYVGVDYASPRADLLADAHAIPFRDGTFDVVLSYAVLEHLYHPFAAASEVARVLRPGGLFVGTVAQGEPFHDSYFHHTAWGLLGVLSSAGLRMTRCWPSYDTLHALAGMGRYPRVQRLLIELVHRIGTAAPFLAPRKLFWSARQKAVNDLHRAASIAFVAEKLVDR